MRELFYEVAGTRLSSYTEARKLQPTGKLNLILEEVIEPIKCSAETRAKRIEAIRKRGN
jgi:hypothetical protein